MPLSFSSSLFTGASRVSISSACMIGSGGGSEENRAIVSASGVIGRQLFESNSVLGFGVLGALGFGVVEVADWKPLSCTG